MGKELDTRIQKCKTWAWIMKEDCTKAYTLVQQAKPVLAKCEKLLSEYISLKYGSEKDPKKADKTWKEFASLVKQGVAAMESIREVRYQLEKDMRYLEISVSKLSKHIVHREKKSLFRSKSHTKDAKGLLKSYSQFLGMVRTATEDGFRLTCDFGSLQNRFLKGVA